jgi:hypothetical protein
MIGDIEEFIKQFHGQRRRTQWLVDVIPEAKANWRPWPDEPSPAEIICRLAATHLMYATVAAHDYWYVDDFEGWTDTWERAQEYFAEKTEAALDLLRPLPDSALAEKRHKLDGNPPTPAWRFLMAMLDAEIGGRMQLDGYLMLLNVRRPSLSSFTLESVREALAQMKEH